MNRIRNKPFIVAYTKEEGGYLLPWLFHKQPSAFILKIHIEGISQEKRLYGMPANRVLFAADLKAGIRIKFHSLYFSDGREWDTVNGWRWDGKPYFQYCVEQKKAAA